VDAPSAGSAWDEVADGERGGDMNQRRDGATDVENNFAKGPHHRLKSGEGGSTLHRVEQLRWVEAV